MFKNYYIKTFLPFTIFLFFIFGSNFGSHFLLNFDSIIFWLRILILLFGVILGMSYFKTFRIHYNNMFNLSSEELILTIEDEIFITPKKWWKFWQ